jgi:hypothetical protein
MSLVGQEIPTIPEHMSSPPFLVGFVFVTRSLVLCVCFVDRCLSFCTFSFGHCVTLKNQSFIQSIKFSSVKTNIGAGAGTSDRSGAPEFVLFLVFCGVFCRPHSLLFPLVILLSEWGRKYLPFQST